MADEQASGCTFKIIDDVCTNALIQKSCIAAADLENDPLQMLSDLARDAAQDILDGWELEAYAKPSAKLERLQRVRRLLIRNARYVPRALDEVIELAEDQGGLRH